MITRETRLEAALWNNPAMAELTRDDLAAVEPLEALVPKT